ncbi:MAG: DUF2141 domain-containing protein [Polyangiaceae bacterium]|nr:DUF2141 domain-containing protein [Polyangiaceae bacterium]
MNISTALEVLAVTASVAFTAFPLPAHHGRPLAPTGQVGPTEQTVTTNESEPAPQAADGSIKFTVQVESKKKGVVLCALYDEEDKWLGEQVYRRASATVDGGWVTCVFPAVSKNGKYAIAALHDEDGDGQMDKIMGIPQEGYSMSRDAQNKSLVPKWKNAVFAYAGEATEQVGHMKY